MREILKKLRKYEIQIRKAINSQMQGDYRSVFKGAGLEFDDVRAYQYGDDVRTIDWNVSAKGHGTFVKTFKEDKEQTVFFMLDVSASEEIGSPGQQKLDIGKEVCGVLALAAAKESSQVGMVCFSDQREAYIKPSKGVKKAYEVISRIFALQPKSAKTDINDALIFTLKSLRKRAVIFIISDFIDEGYHANLKAMAKKHDLIVIQISDKRETLLPKLGIIPVYDKENKKMVYVNTSAGGFRSKLIDTYVNQKEALEKLCKKHQINYLSIDTNEEYIPQLIKLFKIRNKTIKSV